MNLSLSKYLKRPVVKEISSTTLDQGPQPMVYLCQKNYFNYSLARTYGYEYRPNFLAGILHNSTSLSWRSIYDNATFQMMSKLFYNSDYSDTKAFDEWDTYGHFVNTDKFQQKLTFIPSHGFCLELRNLDISRKFFITTSADIKVMILDSQELNRYKLKETSSSYAETLNNKLTAAYYDVKYTMHDERILDGSKCTDYDKLGTNYKLCIETAFENQMLRIMRCLPPWMSDTHHPNKKCQNEKQESDLDNGELMIIIEELDRLISNQDLTFTQHCLPPCTKLEMDVTRIWYSLTIPDESIIGIISKREVQVWTSVFSYDALDLIVDLGSSLGLWLGLSALSFVDLSILYVPSFLKFFLRKC